MTTEKRTENPCILFVCMQHSPHAARWIDSLADRGWDLHLFPMNYEPALATLRGVTLHRPFLQVTAEQLRRAPRTSPRRWWCSLVEAVVAAHPHRLPQSPVYPLPLTIRAEAALDRFQVRTGESDATAPLFFGARTLARVIRRLKPDLIHSMEFQHCSYKVLRARELMGPRFPPWLATNWGSDIYHFRKDPRHRAQLVRLLRHLDLYSCECRRDIDLARELGMTAKPLPVMPNSGGFDLAEAARLRAAQPTSQRRAIMVKGYQHFAGRALTALAALERVADVVRDFEIVIFSPSHEAMQRADELRAQGTLTNITVVPWASHEDMLRMHARARVYLGVSVSDAISTSALEAMAMGAFPIQTDTSCCDEWFEDGQGGYLIPADDVDTIAARIRSALTDDALVDRAAAINWRVVEARLDEQVLRRQVWSFYDEAFAHLRGRARV